MKSAKFVWLFLVSLAVIFFVAATGIAKTPLTFTVATPGKDTVPTIVLQYDPTTQTGIDWNVIKRLDTDDFTTENAMRVSVNYLVEGIRRMTGRTLPVISSNDLSKGIVLTTLKGAPADVQNDPAVIKALANTGEDAYNANEAFFIRSEKNRLLIVANQWDGLSEGIVDLLETAGYEILAIGQDWIYTPDYHNKPLAFTLARAGRPSFYIRNMNGGGTYGTTYGQDPPAPDEGYITSKMRWKTGWRLWGASCPPYPGHAWDSYHWDIVQRMKATGSTEGFLAVTKTVIGPEAQRPAAAANDSMLWITNDPPSTPGADKVYISNGKDWVPQTPSGFGPTATLDPSVPMVREFILERMKAEAIESFAANPNDIFLFGNEPEDGSFPTVDRDVKYRNWYPEYLAAEMLPFGRPYALQGYRGLNQPVEIWDPAAASDQVFGFHNWLLHEYDKWIDSLPPEQRVTATGKDKKAQVRISGYSYGNHDVPPNFNLDPRMHIMIAGYPKHRGVGKWVKFTSFRDLAGAFQVLLPGEASGEYRILSIADYNDEEMADIPTHWNPSAAALLKDHKGTYNAGTKALSMETDNNTGKHGLAYYLINRLLWNVNMTPAQVDALRNRWLQRAYGSAWKEMKTYYDFMLPVNYPSNGPGTWSRAIRLIDVADKKLVGKNEPDAQRRLDDMKQFWYFYYLLDSGKAKPDDADFKKFMWKCQMSYVNSTDMLVDFFPSANRDPRIAAGDFSKGPAHYSHAETQVWWNKILKHWPLTEVSAFADATLANGKAGRNVDLNDLVAVKELRGAGSEAPVGVERNETFFYTLARKAGDEIGYHLFWPFNPSSRTSTARTVNFGLDYWNARTKSWELILNQADNGGASMLVTRTGGAQLQSVDVRIPARKPGVYRFTTGGGGTDSQLAGLNYDVAAMTYAGITPITYTFAKTPCSGMGKAYFYIPKGIKRLDLELADKMDRTLVLYTGLPSAGMKESRRRNLSGVGTHRIQLLPDEDGTLAQIEPVAGNTFFFPYLYSVPMLWASSSDALLVPRGVAQADGLTIIP